MHQSGHWRAHNMQTVQFSSLSAVTPRARAGGSSRSCGYCTVTAGFIIVLKVTPSPPSIPLISRFMCESPSERHLQDTRREDVQQRDRHEPLPGLGLELVFTEPRIRE